MQVDFEHGLQQPHVGSLIQPHLVFPDVDNENLTRRKRKERTLALEVLILASLATVSSLHVHDQDVISHALRRAGVALLLVVRKPDTLGRLPSLQLRHHGELGTEEVIEQCGLSGGLRTKHGDEMIIETSRRDIFKGQIFGQIGTIVMRSAFKRYKLDEP